DAAVDDLDDRRKRAGRSVGGLPQFVLVLLPRFEGGVDRGQRLSLADVVKTGLSRLRERTPVFSACHRSAETVVVTNPDSSGWQLPARKQDAPQFRIDCHVVSRDTIFPPAKIGGDDGLSRDGPCLPKPLRGPDQQAPGGSIIERRGLLGRRFIL